MSYPSHSNSHKIIKYGANHTKEYQISYTPLNLSSKSAFLLPSHNIGRTSAIKVSPSQRFIISQDLIDKVIKFYYADILENTKLSIKNPDYLYTSSVGIPIINKLKPNKSLNLILYSFLNGIDYSKVQYISVIKPYVFATLNLENISDRGKENLLKKQISHFFSDTILDIIPLYIKYNNELKEIIRNKFKPPSVLSSSLKEAIKNLNREVQMRAYAKYSKPSYDDIFEYRDITYLPFFMYIFKTLNNPTQEDYLLSFMVYSSVQTGLFPKEINVMSNSIKIPYNPSRINIEEISANNDYLPSLTQFFDLDEVIFNYMEYLNLLILEREIIPQFFNSTLYKNLPEDYKKHSIKDNKMNINVEQLTRYFERHENELEEYYKVLSILFQEFHKKVLSLKLLANFIETKTNTKLPASFHKMLKLMELLTLYDEYMSYKEVIPIKSYIDTYNRGIKVIKENQNNDYLKAIKDEYEEKRNYFTRKTLHELENYGAYFNLYAYSKNDNLTHASLPELKFYLDFNKYYIQFMNVFSNGNLLKSEITPLFFYFIYKRILTSPVN